MSDEQEKSSTSNPQAETVLKPLFDKDADDDDDKGLLSFAEGFRDKVKVLFDHFDADGDGFLKYDELRKLQAATEGVVLSEEMYVMACKALNCHPKNGVSLEALKFTYASEGADIEKDFEKVFGKAGNKKDEDATNPKEKKDEDVIYDEPSPSDVQPLPVAQGFRAIPFAVAMPSSSLQDPHQIDSGKLNKIGEETSEAAATTNMSLMGDNGIVGSIVIMGQKSAMIWVGWGHLQLFGASESTTTKGFGTGTPNMGQLLVAMPRTHYKGAFGGTHNKEPSCSMLVGSASSEDQMLANQMASRLSTQMGMAIYVSCQLSLSSSSGEAPGGGGGGGNELDPLWSIGLDSDTIAHQAAALAEKEIRRILQEQQSIKKK